MPALKGAFIDVSAGLLGGLPNIVVFQFNPETVTRSPSLAQPPRPPTGAGAQDTLQQPDEPTESISFSLRIDASDQLARFDPLTIGSGILPTLYALELLMIPKSSFTVDLAAAANQSTATNPPLTLPTVLFAWGAYRMLPVTVSNLSITEQQYDTRLNPVRAEVYVNLQVLLPSQVAAGTGRGGSLARGAYQYTQKVKEVMAALNISNNAQIGASLVLPF